MPHVEDGPLPRDRLREGPVRLLGYANEVGESFKPLIPRTAYLSSYAVSATYVVADAAWRGSHPPSDNSSVIEAVDTLLWQGMASVAFPGYVINRVVWAARHTSIGRTSASVRTWLPTAAGLFCIPFIVKPIDRSVEVIFESCLRPWYKRHS